MSRSLNWFPRLYGVHSPISFSVTVVMDWLKVVRGGFVMLTLRVQRKFIVSSRGWTTLSYSLFPNQVLKKWSFNVDSFLNWISFYRYNMDTGNGLVDNEQLQLEAAKNKPLDDRWPLLEFVFYFIKLKKIVKKWIGYLQIHVHGVCEIQETTRQRVRLIWIEVCIIRRRSVPVQLKDQLCLKHWHQFVAGLRCQPMILIRWW